MEVGTPVSMATRTGPAECPQYIMEEEYTVGVPLVSTKIGQNVAAPRQKIAEFAYSIDLDEVAHNEPPHSDLQCLPSGL